MPLAALALFVYVPAKSDAARVKCVCISWSDRVAQEARFRRKTERLGADHTRFDLWRRAAAQVNHKHAEAILDLDRRLDALKAAV